MNYLQYKSSEMFSSTQLIRKSKSIFDKIENHEIDKAVILRDGKPSFIMMEFETYEIIMNEYEKLKKLESILDKDINKLDENNQVNVEIKEETKDEIKLSNENKDNENTNGEKENKKSALLDKLDSIDGIIINDTNEKPENLKDFWE